MIDHRRITLHPVKKDGTLDLNVNLYPKTLVDGVVDRDGNEVDIATQQELDIGLNLKVDKEYGKGLSANDFTDQLKEDLISDTDKLATIETGAEVNVKSDWNATEGDAEILNKPTTIAGYGITDAYTKSEIDSQESGLDTRLSAVEGKIPAEATASNQLADKEFVEHAIAVSEATFKGTLDVVSDLDLWYGAYPSQIEPKLNRYHFTVAPDNNDYCYVINKDINQNTIFERYKYASQIEWKYEYTVSNISLDTEQWEAINSGINRTTVDTFNAHLTLENNPHNVTKAQVGLGNVDNTSDVNKPISTVTQAALDSKVDKVSGKVLSSNDFTDVDKFNLDTNTEKRHEHINKNLLDTYDQTNADISSAVNLKHTHNNKAILDATTASYVLADQNKLANIESNAQVNVIEGIQVNGVDLPVSSKKVNVNITGKVDKTDLANKVYGTNNSSAQTTFDISTTATADNIVKRIAAGQITVPATPSANTDASSKGYVDTKVADALNSLDITTINNTAGKTIASISEANGIVSATFQDIKAQANQVVVRQATQAESELLLNQIIPSQVSSVNELADKSFVNSSISTSTADFLGTLDVKLVLGLDYGASISDIVNALNSHSFSPATPTNNDYCYVINKDASGNTLYQRFKFNSDLNPSSWLYEYQLNNSSFTAAQWAALNSGATAAKAAEWNAKYDFPVGGIPASDLASGVVNDATITFYNSKTSSTIGSITLNQSSNETISLNIPESYSDVHALPESTRYANTFDLGLDQLDPDHTTIVITLKDQNSEVLATKSLTLTGLANLDLDEVGDDGKYIKYISQEDGLVDATAVPFDTVVNNGSADENAPTSRAVHTAIKNLVQGEDGAYLKTIVEDSSGIVKTTKQAFDTAIPATNNNPSNINAPTTKAVRDAINTLDVADLVEHPTSGSAGGNLQTLATLLEEDGKIQATFQDIQSATTSQKGVVQLDNTIDDDTANAATPKAVKDYARALAIAQKVVYATSDTETATGSGKYTQTTVAYNTTATEGYLVQRATNGQIVVPQTPTDNAHAASKQYVDAAISSNTGAFLGNLDCVNDLGLNYGATHTQVETALALYTFSITPTNNDYCIVVNQDANQNTIYERYKYTVVNNSGSWAFEYSINNSSFNSDQWDAINSGIKAEFIPSDVSSSNELATKGYVDTYGGKIDSISIEGTPQTIDANKNVDLPAYPTRTSLGINNVVNTGDSATPVENGTTKFTTGGAYTELNKKADKVSSATSGDIAELDNNGNLVDSGILSNDIALINAIPGYQATIAVVKDAVTNINEYPSAAQNHYSAVLTSGTPAYYTIYYDNDTSTPLTRAQAENYMRYMTGSTFLPEYIYESPKNSILMFADKTLWKPQFDTINGLRLYRLSTALATTADITSTITVTDVKINNSSILSNKIANFNTKTAYNATTNKIATDADLPHVLDWR